MREVPVWVNVDEERADTSGDMSLLSPLLVGRVGGLLMIGSGLLTTGYAFLSPPMDRAIVLAISGASVAIGAFCRFAPWDRWRRSATLWALPVAFALIATGNYYGTQQPWTFGVFFIVAFTWVGIGHAQWTSARFAPLAAIAYVTPILLRGEGWAAAASVTLTIPVGVLVGESLSWIGGRAARSQERAEILARTATALGSHLSEPLLLQTMVDTARQALGSEHTVLYQLDPDARTVRAVFSSGVDERTLERLGSLVGRSYDGHEVVEFLIASRRPLVVPDVARSTLVEPQYVDTLQVRSAVAIPIVVRDELLGVLTCGETTRLRSYNADDISLATALAAQASVALQNALLYERTAEAARRDPMTNLGNRRAFHERFEEEFERARRHDRALSLILIDPDEFKVVNDTWGHQSGDRVLAQLASLFERSIRSEDAAFRIGGDEFAVILPETSPVGASVFAERIRRTIERAHPAVGNKHRLTASIGVASYPIHGGSPDEVFSRADTALYEVKGAGGDAVAFPYARTDAGPDVRFGVDLGEVIDGRHLEPVYQPIVDLGTGRVVGFEGFCRLDPALGSTPVPTLFRAAGALGLVAELDDACRAAVLGGAASLPGDAVLFVNIHPSALETETFDVDRLIAAVDGAGLPLERVVLEVTEQGRSPEGTRLSDRLRLCRERGFLVALDDLGAGASDLELLARLPFDFVKVDMSFIHGADATTSRKRLLNGLRLMVAETGAGAIAEGVETDDDLRVVTEMGFSIAQGYLLGDPGRGFEPNRPGRVIQPA